MHLVLASKGFRSYPLDLGELADWGPEFVITLIDDVYSVKRRIQLKDFHFSFNQLYEWRTSEIMLADQIGRLATRYFKDSSHAGVESLVVPVKTPAMTLARLLTKRQHPRVYASFPISSTRENPEDRAEIDDFRRKLPNIIPTFDPLTIEEIPLLDCKEQCGDTISFHPTKKPDGTPKTMKEPRWDCRIDTGTWAPLVWEPEIAQDSVGGEVGFFPVEFPRTELEEIFYASPDGGDLVNDHVTVRDLRFVDQADIVVCYRPFWHGPMSKGVARELTHANNTNKPVIAYFAEDKRPSGPLQPKFTHHSKDFDHFWNLIKKAASEEQTLPRPEYY